jgi:serine/threonine-protein kinase
MIGQTLGHYRIEERLGSGGMGVVYRARDTRLGRTVAIKLLGERLPADEHARARLVREARTASSLNHPNICTIHEVGEAEGKIYIAMECVEGEPLSARVAGSGVPLDALLRYGAQIADALEHAHERGIVHRDLKSSNVIINPEGRAKVLDFGLAKRVSPEALGEATRSQATLTEAGAVAGTLQYMPPEVLRGEPADARGDLWALGVVLYEMAAGRLPFAGNTGFEISSAILREPPAALPPRVPAGLKAIIQRCLAKDPAQRYQRAGEVRAALEAVQSDSSVGLAAAGRKGLPLPRSLALTGVAALGAAALAAVLVALNVGGLRERFFGKAAPGQIDSLAVLPLENLSGDPGQEYFADGMTDALITNLAQIRALRVISRTSVLAYKGSRKPLPEIARELNVEAVVEGSVLRVGDRVRITAQLIQAATDRHLWARSYEEEMKDVLRLQGQVAEAIAREIRVQLSPEEKARLARARPVDPEIYQLYLQGTHYLYQGKRGDIEKAMQTFEEVVHRDPNFAPAYVGLAQGYWARGYLGAGDLPVSRETLAKAKDLVLKALELDDALAEAHSMLGNLLLTHDLDLAGAEREHRRALELNPGSAAAHLSYSGLLPALGRFDESVTQAKEALTLDPLSPRFNNGVGWALTFARRYDEAIAQYRRTIDMSPDYEPAHFWLGFALACRGTYSDGIKEIERAIRNSGGNRMWEAYLGHYYALSGRRKEAEGILEEFKRLYSKREMSHYGIALVYTGLGRKVEALDWLERAYAERWGQVAFLKASPAWDSLRAEPRFIELLKKIGLEKS